MTGARAVPAIALALMLMCAAGAMSGEETPAWAIAAYVSADGDLSRVGARYADGLLRFAKAAGVPLALQVNVAAAEAGAVRLLVEGNTTRAEPLPPSVTAGNASAVEAFGRWACNQVAGRRTALIVFGHGLSPGAEGDKSPLRLSAELMLARNERNALSPRELREGLLRAGLRPDVIVLECCFGASLDVLWELRAVTGTVLASPGRRPAEGVPWAAVVDTGIASAADGEQFARVVMESVRSSSRCPAAMTVIRAARVEAVAAAAAELSRTVARNESYVAALAMARRRCVEWGYQRELCDLGQLAAMLAATEAGEVSEAAERVATAVAECVVGKVGLPAGTGGIAVVLPGGRWQAPPGYGKDEAGFAARSGWRELVQRYCQWQQHLIGPKSDEAGLGKRAS